MHTCHLKNAELEPKLEKTQQQSPTPWWHCKRRLVCVPNDCRKNNGCYCKITRLWRTSSWCSICLHSWKIGGPSQIAQNFQSKNVFHDIIGQIHGQTLKMPWVLLNDIEMVICYPDCYGKDNSRKFYLNLDGKKYQIVNVCVVIENKGYFCQFLWLTSKWRWKKLNMAPMWKYFFEERWSWGTNIISSPCIFGMYSALMQT